MNSVLNMLVQSKSFLTYIEKDVVAHVMSDQCKKLLHEIENIIYCKVNTATSVQKVLCDMDKKFSQNKECDAQVALQFILQKIEMVVETIVHLTKTLLKV